METSTDGGAGNGGESPDGTGHGALSLAEHTKAMTAAELELADVVTKNVLLRKQKSRLEQRDIPVEVEPIQQKEKKTLIKIEKKRKKKNKKKKTAADSDAIDTGKQRVKVVAPILPSMRLLGHHPSTDGPMLEFEKDIEVGEKENDKVEQEAVADVPKGGPENGKEDIENNADEQQQQQHIADGDQELEVDAAALQDGASQDDLPPQPFKITLLIENYRDNDDIKDLIAEDIQLDEMDDHEVRKEKPVKVRVSKTSSKKKTPEMVENEDNALTRRFWNALVKRDLPRHTRLFQSYHKKRYSELKKFGESCQREVRGRIARTEKLIRNSQNRMKRLMREMLIFQRKAGKLNAKELKIEKKRIKLSKKAEKAEQIRLMKLEKQKAQEKKIIEAQEARRRAAEEKKREAEEKKKAEEERKRAEEMREAKRQSQRLNFLLTQTELYSHFMASKMKGELSSSGQQPPACLDSDGNAGDDPEDTKLAVKARENAQNAIEKTAAKARAFDQEVALVHKRKGGGKDPKESSPLAEEITKNIIKQPKAFTGDLKKYQLKGLEWLVNLYEQGINGILADEMGLGKTIQAIAFLSYLAEEKDIWGPFLVVAPSSTLHNWASEVQRFCPSLRVLPYWGGPKDRQVFRKSFSAHKLHTKDASFHVLITSYQLVVTDEKHFKRVKWQNMVLDEAQNIKSSQSQRWKALLSFNCRSRLLLTGTPVQNSMAELWALLHFIMPTLFDSHNQFNEWFSKGIEAHATEGGGLDEHQLKRLHAILQPFMLRRVKTDVEEEMPKKTEVTILCDLSVRQRSLYQVLRKQISVADFIRNANINEQSVQNLMNILAQLRKVCNHPELFEHQEARSPFQFSTQSLHQINASSKPRETSFVSHWGWRSPISMHIPKLIFRHGMTLLSAGESGSPQGFRRQWLFSKLSIFKADNVYYSACPQADPDELIAKRNNNTVLSGAFGFASLIGLSPGDVERIASGNELERWSHYRRARRLAQTQREYYALQRSHNTGKASWMPPLLSIPMIKSSWHLRRVRVGESKMLPPLVAGTFYRLMQLGNILKAVRAYTHRARAPAPDLCCSDQSMTLQNHHIESGGWQKSLLVGEWPNSELQNVVPESIKELASRNLPPRPLLMRTFRYFGGDPELFVSQYSLAKALTDSGKLLTLDRLLGRLRADNHRVLIFCQMTKMMNLLEEYMHYKHLRYFRLDGSTGVSERRDLVNEFQTNEDIFIFLLSTRAGGLGINLTAADTVIFYESDWNPTMDLQAMDRAHRLGQKKDVTVYRILCRGTIEEKIVKRARQKNTVQQLVMTGGDAKVDVFEPEEALSLLIDDTEMEQQLRDAAVQRKKNKRGKAKGMKWGKGSKRSGGVLKENRASVANGKNIGKVDSIVVNGNEDELNKMVNNGNLSKDQEKIQVAIDGNVKSPSKFTKEKDLKEQVVENIRSTVGEKRGRIDEDTKMLESISSKPVDGNDSETKTFKVKLKVPKMSPTK